MIVYDLKLALRRMMNEKVYVGINVVGLAVGIASCVLILLYVQDELSYDAHHAHADRIFRVVDENTARTPILLGPVLRTQLPEVVDYTRLKGTTGVWLMKTGDNEYLEENVYWADPSLIDIFDIGLTIGDMSSALDAPYSMVITEGHARKYFGDANPIGQTVNADNVFNFQVTGVMKALPRQSHFEMDMVVSLSSLEQTNIDRGYPDHGRYLMSNWIEKEYYTYLLLAAAADVAALPRRIQETLNEYGDPEVRSDDGQVRYQIQPLRSIHLDSHLMQEMANNAQRSTIWVLTAIALFLLFIAGINFMNLTTARSIHRSLEVGLRKTVGAGRWQLIRLFLVESLLVSVFATGIAVLLVQLAMEPFNLLSDKELSLNLLDYRTWTGLAATSLIVGLSAGLYPALGLASFRPMSMLRSKNYGVSGAWLQKALVVAQIVISIVLVSGTMVVSRQLTFMQSSELGFDKEHILATPIPVSAQNVDGRALLRLREGFTDLPGVAAMSMSSYLPGRASGRGLLQTATVRRLDEPALVAIEAQMIFTMWDYLKTLDLTVLEGRDFDFTRPYSINGVSEVILNETAIRSLGWNEAANAMGKLVHMRDQDYRIVGMVKDFHATSLHSPISPMAISVWNTNFLGIRLKPGNISETLDRMTAIWEENYPDFPFAYSFLDDDFDNLYRSETRLAGIVTIFTGLAILIACIGLLGLVAFTVERRTKEMGVRRVLGASNAELMLLLSGTFIQWVVAGSLLGVPMAYIISRAWLQAFAYQTEISIDIFVYACGSVFLLSLLTISSHVIRSASTDPVEALRTE